jgi:PIN domain nuclease of toxin-antitoxin system
MLDTHAFMWSLINPERLPPRTRGVLADRANEVLVSTVVVWEIAIKVALGKLRFPPNLASWLPRELEAYGYTTLPVQLEHAEALEHMPLLHRDPFDRLLIAQAQVEQVPIATVDSRFPLYDVDIFWE